MIENSYSIEAVKEKLDAFRDGERELENQSEALERMNAKLMGVGVKEISDMPRSPSPDSDRITDLVYRKMELEQSIKDLIESQARKRKDILRLLGTLKTADERAVIRFRYLLCMNWYDVTDAMFGGRADYIGKEESYLRRTFKIHWKALSGIRDSVGNSTKCI